MVVLRLGLSLSSVSKQHVVVIRLDLSLFSLGSKHIAWSFRYYGWVCRFCHQTVKKTCGCIMVGVIVVVVCQ